MLTEQQVQAARQKIGMPDPTASSRVSALDQAWNPDYVGKGIVDTFKTGGERIAKEISDIPKETTPAKVALKTTAAVGHTALEALKGAGSVLAEPFREAYHALPQDWKDTIGSTAEEAATKGYDMLPDHVKEAITHTSEFLKNNPEYGQAAKDTADLALNYMALSSFKPNNAELSVTKHLKDAQTTLKNIPKADLESLGGMPKFLEQQKINIVDGLKFEGQPEAAKAIEALDLTKFSSFGSFERAVLSETRPLIRQAGVAAGAPVAVAAKAAGKAGKMAGFGVSEVQGALTGTSGETVRQAFSAAKNGGKELEEFTANLRKAETPEKLVGELRDGITRVETTRSGNFSKAIESVGKETVDTSKVVPQVKDILGKIGVQVDEKGSLDFSTSKFRTVPEAQKKLQNMYNEVSRLGDSHTIQDVDTSRQALRALLLTGDDASANTANLAINTAINSVKAAGATNKVYSKALQSFSQDSEFLDELTRSLSSTDRATIDNTYRKLVTVLKTNNEQRMSLLKDLDEATGGYLLSSVAGQQLSEELPRGLFRQIAAGIAGSGVVFGTVSPAIISALVFASPRVTGEVVRALGITARKADELIAAFDKVRGMLKIAPAVDTSGP